MRAFVLFVLFLAASLSFAIETEVNLYVSRNIAPAEKIRLQINTKNLPGIHLNLSKIDSIAWLSHPTDQGKRPTGGKVLRTLAVRVAGEKQKPNPAPGDTYYSRQINLPAMPPGIYLVTSDGAGKGQRWAVVEVTGLAVVAKRSPKRVLVWVTDFKTGLAVPSAGITIYSSHGSRQSATKTDSQGIAIIPRAPGNETVIVNRGQDYAGLPAQAEDPNGHLVAHFQTDRPIYRPGQRVFFKAALRYTKDQIYAVKPGQAVTVVVKDSKDTEIDRISLKANGNGTLEGQTDIPQEGATGPYSLELTADGQDAYQTFTVAAYRKPEFKVDVKPTTARSLAGETIHFKVDANYYFGAPVGQAQVKYTVTRSSLSYGSESDEGGYYSGDGNLYPRDTYAGDDVVADEGGFTDNSGTLDVAVKTDPKAPDSTYRIEVTVTDGSRRQVSGNSALNVFAANIRLGLSSDLLYVPLGKLIPIKVRATDLDGRPVGAKVLLRLIDSVFDKKANKYVEVERARTIAVVTKTGVIEAALPAKAQGSMQVEASAEDGTGRTARASMWMTVIGPFEKAVSDEEEGPTLAVRLDRRIYHPEDKVGAYILTNRPTTTPKAKKPTFRASPILAVIEGQDIYGYRVFNTGQRGQTFDFKVTTAHSPNAFVDVAQWVDGGMITNTVLVPVPDVSRKLNITLTPDKAEYHPGDQATYRIKALDNKGRPVSTEVSLTVVDEAIYALSPDNTADSYRMFWGQRPNQVSTYSAAPEELSGGAYQRVSTVAPLRQRFEDTAFWKAVVETDSNGEATVQFEMPGNLTAWRATARAIDGETRVGMARGSVRATRNVTLRLATPRQMVQGDVLTLIATVNNRTGETRTFDVSIRGGTAGKGRIPVAAHSEGRLEFQLEANGQTLDLTAEAVDIATGTAEYSDALRVPVPVVPNAIQERIVIAKRIQGNGTVTFDLPATMADGGTSNIRIYPGIGSKIELAAKGVLERQRYGTAVAIAQLMVIAGTPGANANDIREPIALLSRTDTGTGWGWWEGARVDPYLTAHVLRALVAVQEAHIPVPPRLLESAKNAASYQYKQTNLWDHRAVLASALFDAKTADGSSFLKEVRERGQNLSPFAKISVATSLKRTGDGAYKDLIEEVERDVSEGPVESYLPVGDGTGWRATEIESNAALLAVADQPLADHLAEWLFNRFDSGWVMDEASTITALRSYLKRHPETRSEGKWEVKFNQMAFPLSKPKVGDWLEVEVPQSLLRSGKNEVSIAGQGSGRVIIENRVNVPIANENIRGIRVVRRYEVRNAAGTWVETTGNVKAGETVRCTVVVWGDSVPDALRVNEPLPAGFEYLDDDAMGTDARQEVRDGAVVHYVMAGGEPLVFRYYIRAESEGKLTALPAVAEVLRRPSNRGNSAPMSISVTKGGER